MSYIRSTRHFPQKATYWSQQNETGYGSRSWAAPVIIQCRWEDSMEEALSTAYRAESEETLSGAIIYTPTPLKEGAYVYLGETTEENPATLKGAFAVRSVHAIPSVRATFTEYSARL